MRVVETDAIRPADIPPAGVHEEVELGIVGCGTPRGEDIVGTPLHPDECSTQIQISRPNVQQDMVRGMQLHSIPLRNRLRMLGFLRIQTISQIINSLSSSRTLTPDLHLCLDLICHLDPWLHGLLRMRTTTRLHISNGVKRGRCRMVQAQKAKGIHIDQCRA